MLITGPAEWSEALLATGVKANLLQNGYNSKLQVSAMSLGPTVAITRYADTDATTGFGRGVLDQPSDTLVLHEEDSDTKATYRLAAWSRGSTDKSLLAIASTTQVEIWEVTISSGICAALYGSVAVDHLQGLAWNPRSAVLLAYSKTDIHLIDASQQALVRRSIHTDTNTRQEWGACSWSPCGLHVSLAQHHVLHCFSWTSVESLLTEPARHDQIDANSSVKGNNRLDVGNASVGPIAAVARVSPTICILTTSTKLILEDISRADPAIASMNSELRTTIPIGTGSPTSNLLLLSDDSPSLNIRGQAAQPFSGIIDLTSMRVSSSSSQNSLQILKRFEDASARQNPQQATPRSHMVTVEFKAGQWSVISILDLPHLTSPDILVIQDMRVIVGSTLSPRVLVAHLDVSDLMEWTMSLSGELELSPTHVCRGIHLAERSPFVDVASIEKRKRATFFHAAANLEPQPVYLSKFKVPRRRRPASSGKPIGSAHESTATAAADKTPKSSDREENCIDGGECKDLLELLLANVAAMQAQLNTRFDHVDKTLVQLTARVEQLERDCNGGRHTR